MATSPSGPGTKIQLTLTGEGADPKTMPSTLETKEDQKKTESSKIVPDTGFFTSNSSTATPFFLGGAIFLILSSLTIAFLVFNRQKGHQKSKTHIKTSFKLQDQKVALKRLGLFSGLFALAFLALGAILPNFIPEDNSASALDASNALSIETGSTKSNNILPMSVAISATPNMAISSESIKVTSATSNGYTLYLSTNGALGNSLYLNGDAAKGYVTPASGSTLKTNQWGFAVGTTASAARKNPAIWRAVPNYGSEVALKQTSSATSAGDETTVFYGALVNNTIPAGDYSNTVLYTAIANLKSPQKALRMIAPQPSQKQPEQPEEAEKSPEEQPEVVEEEIKTEEPENPLEEIIPEEQPEETSLKNPEN